MKWLLIIWVIKGGTFSSYSTEPTVIAHFDTERECQQAAQKMALQQFGSGLKASCIKGRRVDR